MMLLNSRQQCAQTVTGKLCRLQCFTRRLCVGRSQWIQGL
jgi:hypothetical protein